MRRIVSSHQMNAKNALGLVKAAGMIAAAALAFSSSKAGAVVVTPVTASDVPVSMPSSVFDASHTGNVYSLGSGTRFISPNFNASDLFGGSAGKFGPEANDVLFADNQPVGTVNTVEVTLESPVLVTGFDLFLEDDGTNGDRSAREFRLYADGQLVDDINLLDDTATQSYTSVYGSNYIQISEALAGLSASADYQLEFVQNHDGNYTSGVRALDFQVTGTNAPTSVPEPTAITGMLVAGTGLTLRHRRI